MGTCYKPTKDTNCVEKCVVSTDDSSTKGFYKDRDGDIFDYEFSSDERNMAVADGTIKTTSGIAGSSLFTEVGVTIEGDETDHVDLCERKRTEKIEKHAIEQGAATWMSSGELVIWLIIAGIMYGIYTMFESKMPYKESFLCFDLPKSSYLNMGVMGKIYVLLCFVIMFVIRKITQTKSLHKINLLSIREYINDFLPYSVISLGAYTFFSGFLRMKASEQEMKGGGPLDFFKNMNTTTLTVYVGIILMTINAFGLSYLYLKDKAKFRKDNYAKALYWGQITTLLIGGLTALCTAFFACHGILSGKGLGYNSYIIVRWLLIIGVVIGCIILIDTETAKPHFYLQESEDLSGKEYWFGNSTRAEREYVADNTVALGAYRRDLGYNQSNAPASWKAEAYKQVYGECHERTSDSDCEAQYTTRTDAGVSPSNHVCTWGADRCVAGPASDSAGSGVVAEACTATSAGTDQAVDAACAAADISGDEAASRAACTAAASGACTYVPGG